MLYYLSTTKCQGLIRQIQEDLSEREPGVLEACRKPITDKFHVTNMHATTINDCIKTQHVLKCSRLHCREWISKHSSSFLRKRILPNTINLISQRRRRCLEVKIDYCYQIY